MRRVWVTRRSLIFVLALVLLATGTVSMLSAPSRVQAQDVVALPKSTNGSPLNIYASNSPTLVPPVIPPPKQVPLPASAPVLPVQGFDEPLVATGASNAQDDADLNATIAAFHGLESTAQDFADLAPPFIDYVTKHPASVWNMAIQTNL